MKHKKEDKKTRKGKWRKILLAGTAVILLVLITGAGMMFQEELKISGSVRLMEKGKNVYYMEADSDYHFGEFLESGGASSDEEVSAFLTSLISKGFYQVEVKNEGTSCSVISALDAEKSHVWGRNFDWEGSIPIIVKCAPKDGYASISTCDFQNITGSTEIFPEDFMNKMLAIAAVYVPMDGINEMGLCVADLEVNEGGMKEADTAKPDLTVTTAIRLLLNRAATVEEAVDLLSQYDIHASGGISHHIAISDATGASVSVEFVNGEMIAVDTDCITNFNLANGDVSAGGASAKERYELLCAVYEDKNGILTDGDVKDALRQVAKEGEQWSTQWSIVYRQDTQTVDYSFAGGYHCSFSDLFTAGKSSGK